MPKSNSQRKLRAARLSMATAAGLALVKFGAGLLTGSLAVLSSAIDSLLDILMSGVNFLAIRQAEQPPDQSHPFGHGKFETLATLIQSFVIAASGAWIIYESLQRLQEGSTPRDLGGGMLVLLASAGVSLWISRYLKRIARQTESSALEADSLHFSMDVYTNAALVVGLALIAWLEANWLDPVLSLLVACYILFEAFRLVRHGLGDILDEGLPEAVRLEITNLIDAHQEHLIDYHHLRTRRAGSQKIINFHLTVCKHLSIAEGHEIADHLERRIADTILGADVTIHIEPCPRENCPGEERCRAERRPLQPPPGK